MRGGIVHDRTHPRAGSARQECGARVHCAGPRVAAIGDANGCAHIVSCDTACSGDTTSDCGPVACGYFADQAACVAACEAAGWDLDCFVVHSGHDMCVHFGQFCGLTDPGGGPASCG